tara:strand:+ start:12764 stop:14467 length:1704 start_codon:yes stop_codon:yes gene_type:complete
MGADNVLVQGAYYAAGGGVDTNWKNAWNTALVDSFNTALKIFSPAIQEKAQVANAWAKEQLGDAANSGINNRTMRELESTYRLKKINFMFAGPAEQTAIIGELFQDKKELQSLKTLQNKTAIKIGDAENGFAEHTEFLGGPVIESITKGLSSTPKRNKDGKLGIMVWNQDTGGEEFKTFTEVDTILETFSRDANTTAKVNGLLDESTQQSLSLPFNSNFYDYNSNYRSIHNNLVKNGDLETLNEYENAPGRVFKNDFIEMLRNNEYERLGITVDGSSMSSFLGLKKRDKKRLQRRIDKLDPNTDGDSNKISEADAEAIYQAMKKDKRMNQQYLSTYLTNMSEQRWMNARWGRSDAPSGEEVNNEANKQMGIYTDHDSVWDYKIENGKWLTKRKDDTKNNWFDISDNDVATDRLNNKYPEAITSDAVSTTSKVSGNLKINDDLRINTETGEVSSKLQNDNQRKSAIENIEKWNKGEKEFPSFEITYGNYDRKPLMSNFRKKYLEWGFNISAGDKSGEVTVTAPNGVSKNFQVNNAMQKNNRIAQKEMMEWMEENLAIPKKYTAGQTQF